MLRKRKEQSYLTQTKDEIFAAEHEARELWEKLKADMVAGRMRPQKYWRASEII